MILFIDFDKQNHCRQIINLQQKVMTEPDQSENQPLQPHQLTLNTKNEFYADQLNESKVHSVISVISHSTTPQNLLKYFQQYPPLSSSSPPFSLPQLHSSPSLKLKKYKESVYYGQFSNNKRHGRGIMLYDNSRLYEGWWENDYKHGRGFEKFPNLCVYEGEYVNGKPEGIGKYTWANGEFYQGQWANGHKNGSGMWRGAKGDSYIGEWKYGRADGYGVHTWVNGDRYQGEFKECLKDGEGIQRFGNGDIYKGKYVKGKPEGFGEYYWANGSYFKGMFKNGLRDGQGMWKRGTGNSDKYEGQYASDKKNGYGIFTWATGNIYKGNYQADMRCGYGQMYWNDGSFYKGQWKNGIQHGQGEIYVPGQGLKKGIFQQNVLVILEKQSQIVDDPNHYLTHEPNPQKNLYRKQKSQKPGLLPSKLNFRSRQGQVSKPKPRETKSIDQNIVIRYGVSKQPFESSSNPHPIYNKNHPLLPQKLRKQPKFLTLERRVTRPKPDSENQKKFRTKQRILHSSFYMHKLHNRATTSINGSRAGYGGSGLGNGQGQDGEGDGYSGYSASQQYRRNGDEQVQKDSGLGRKYLYIGSNAKDARTPVL